ncbi:MAG: hypothetical protein P8170_23800, partial [Gemmatimonadota bacterium]
MKSTLVYLTAGVLGLATSPGVTAQTESSDDGSTLAAHRVENGSGVELDGRLDDLEWDHATPVSDFTQQEPVEGGTPSRETEVRVIYDDTDLIIGAMIY